MFVTCIHTKSCCYIYIIWHLLICLLTVWQTNLVYRQNITYIATVLLITCIATVLCSATNIWLPQNISKCFSIPQKSLSVFGSFCISKCLSIPQKILCMFNCIKTFLNVCQFPRKFCVCLTHSAFQTDVSLRYVNFSAECELNMTSTAGLLLCEITAGSLWLQTSGLTYRV